MPAKGESLYAWFLSRTTRVFNSSLPEPSPRPRDAFAASGWTLRRSRLLREAPTTLALVCNDPHRTAGGMGTRTVRCYLAFAARAFDTVLALRSRLASLRAHVSVPRRLASGLGL
ncbi:hypothetical protein EXIGLDRAFT_763285 [Exidia glandulosa HHB12029]|uniref:Uncharacterized protein n=1 Tax=Exidia glandulosa HHB12029 TaxID=1314781 RepID=A0A165M6B5_EXIGL|nr:hypothetical protein EXIGLDRAFT_763285 [Exidia glandulosa HHB12029]